MVSGAVAQAETFPAASTACAQTRVVVLAASGSAMWNCPSASAVPDATAVAEQPSVVKRSTRAPTSAAPTTVTCAWFVGDGGTVPVRPGAAGASVSFAPGGTGACGHWLVSEAQTFAP